MGMPHLRYVSFSYSSGLTERDNTKFRKLVDARQVSGSCGVTNSTSKKKVRSKSPTTRRARSSPRRSKASAPENAVIGWLSMILTMSINPNPTSSEPIPFVGFVRRSPTGLTTLDDSAIIIIMQRVHQLDISGFILEQGWPYCHLMVPMEFESGREPYNTIGWVDPRTEDGDLAWPERFSPEAVANIEQREGQLCVCRAVPAAACPAWRRNHQAGALAALYSGGLSDILVSRGRNFL